MPGRLEGKVALISGGASGIGAAAAKRFVAEGARVVLGDVQTEKAERLAAELGASARSVALDVRDERQWADAAAAARSAFGSLTTVVNSAGISVPATIEDATLDHFRQTIAINLEGTFLGCKAAVAALKDGKGGAIVNVCSTLGVKAGAVFTAYSASKGGVRMLSKAVALHCAAQGYDIRVNTIFPGAIHTEMVEGYIAAGEAQGATRDQVIEGFAAAHALKRLGRPQEAADAILFYASDESSFCTGGELAVDGGLLIA
ncbi:MAG: SDR family oxidoreductase [Alphaproteobacteria bacterium]|nr:SDR family oxidoreductase [Alphaproteobacteria bacterium]